MGAKISEFVAALFVSLSLFLVLSPLPVQAITLEFDPVSRTVTQGEPATVDVVVRSPGTLIGTYDFFVNFDPTILSWSGVTPGTALGAGTGDSFFGIDDSIDGSLNIFEVSFLQDLTGLQDGTSDIILFSILFDTLAVGTSPLSFSGNISPSGDFLGDDTGNPIVLDQTGSGSITVTAANPIPEPGTLLLVGAGLTGLVLCRRRKDF